MQTIISPPCHPTNFSILNSGSAHISPVCDWIPEILKKPSASFNKDDLQSFGSCSRKKNTFLIIGANLGVGE